MTYKLLIVDDELANLRLLERLFSREYNCLTASSGAEAIRLLEQHDVAVLITDQRMPEMTGIDLLKQTAQLRPHMVRILLTGYTDVDALVEALNCGLVYMYFSKPWNNDDLKLKVSRAVEHYENNKKRNFLVQTNERLLLGIKEMKLRLVTGLTDMLKTRDEHGYGHAMRVRQYARTIAQTLDMSEDDKDELSAAALLHHLASISLAGRAGLRLPCSVTNHAAIARAHFECEARLMAATPELDSVTELIKFHRENFDGTGLAGLQAEQIPLASRILRVADEYDLMIQPKAQTAPMRHDEAMMFLLQRSGKQFDPRVIEIMSHQPLDHPDLMDRTIDSGEFESPEEGAFTPEYVDAMFS